MTSDVILTQLDDRILTVTLNRPDAMNALSIELAHELTRTWQRASRPDVHAVVLTGAGRGFCAGADLREPRTGDIAAESLQVTFHPQLVALVALEKPVVAAINGPAAGAGLSLALAADVRVASPSAKLVPAFGRIGLIPDTGVGYLASRVLGEAAAFAWLSAGATMTADDALARGVVERVVDDPVGEAIGIARTLADTPGRAYGLTKRIMWAEGRRLLANYLTLEVELQRLAVEDPERAAARASAVSDLRQPRPSRGVSE